MVHVKRFNDKTKLKEGSAEKNITNICSTHLNEHFNTRDSLEGQQQEGHEGQSLTLRGLLQSSDHSCKLGVALPVIHIKEIVC